MADYLHACTFSPAFLTFQTAIRKDNFVAWPANTTINFDKFVSDKTSTYYGHLDQVSSSLQSTEMPPKIQDDFPHKTYNQQKKKRMKKSPKSFLFHPRNFLMLTLLVYFCLSHQEAINIYNLSFMIMTLIPFKFNNWNQCR